MAENVQHVGRIRMEKNMIPKQKKLDALNADIRGMVKAIKDFKAKERPPLKQMIMRQQSRCGAMKKRWLKIWQRQITRRLSFITPRQTLSMKIRSLQSAACLDLLA